MLQKYQLILDKFKELKNQLYTDFQYLKEAKSKNIDNLQQALNLQQSYSTALCGHLNLLYSKLAKIELQIHHNCKHTPPNGDEVQIDAPDNDLDTDGPVAPGEQQTSNSVIVSVQEIFTLPESVSLDALITEEDLTSRDRSEPSSSNSEATHRTLNPSQSVLDDQELSIPPIAESNTQTNHNFLKKSHN